MIFLALSACWRGNDAAEVAEPDPPAARPKGASCKEVSTNTRKLLEQSTDPDLVQRAGSIGRIVLRRCDQDEWSIELRRCVASAVTVEDSRLCTQLATKTQEAAFQHDLEVFEVSEDGQ